MAGAGQSLDLPPNLRGVPRVRAWTGAGNVYPPLARRQNALKFAALVSLRGRSGRLNGKQAGVAAGAGVTNLLSAARSRKGPPPCTAAGCRPSARGQGIAGQPSILRDLGPPPARLAAQNRRAWRAVQRLEPGFRKKAAALKRGGRKPLAALAARHAASRTCFHMLQLYEFHHTKEQSC